MTASFEAELWALTDEGPDTAVRRLRELAPREPWRHRDAFSAALGRAVRPAAKAVPGERRFHAPRPHTAPHDEPLRPEAAALVRELLGHVKRPLTAQTAILAEECARGALRDAVLQVALLSAVTAAADAGDAGFVFERLDHAWDLIPEDARLRFSSWMVENGTGELRSRGFEPLVIRMADILSRRQPGLAARLLIAGFSGDDGRSPALERGTPPEELATMLVRAVEAAEPSCIAEIIERVPADMRGDVVDATFQEGIVACKSELEAAMTSGGLSDVSAAVGWRSWARSPRAACLRPSNPHVARLALEQVVQVASARSLGAADAISAVVGAALELLEPSEWEPLLVQLLGEPGAAPPIADALDATLCEPHPYTGKLGRGAIRARMTLLRERVPRTAQVAARDELTALQDSLQWVVRDVRLVEPGTPGEHLAALLHNVNRLVLDPDLGETQIAVDGETLHVQSRSIAVVLSDRFSPEEQRRLAELFVIHELVHLVQGIGRKDDVRAIRTRGLLGEMTLMQLDLAADHLAARVLATLRCEGSLVELKELQARSLAMFPFTWPQGASSRRRKSLRLASLRLDAALRRARPGLIPERRYLAVDAQPRSEQIHVLEIDELVRVHLVDVEAGVSDALVRAAQHGDEVTPVIERAAQAALRQW